MGKTTHVDYDKEEDILSLSYPDKVKDSVRLEDIIIDFNYNSKIVGIEIINARRFFESFDITADYLNYITSAKLKVNYGTRWFSIMIILFSKKGTQHIEKEITIPAFDNPYTKVAVPA